MNSHLVEEIKPHCIASEGLQKLLVRHGLASVEQITRAKSVHPDCMLLTALDRCGVLDEHEAIRRIAELLAVPCFETPEMKAGGGKWDAESLQKIDLSYALSRRCLPVERRSNGILVVMADPLDIETVQSLEFMLEARIAGAIACERDIISSLRHFAGMAEPELAEYALADSKQSTVGAPGSYRVAVESDVELTSPNAVSGSDSAPVIQLVNRILSDAMEAGASDIHLEPAPNTLELRFRVDGVMTHILSIPAKLQPYVVTRIKLLARMDITERRRPQDGRFRINCGKAGRADLRVSTVPTPNGEKLVLRILKSSAASVTFESLGFDEHTLVRISRSLQARDRLFVVTGPTGSGKTTTLYSALNLLREGNSNIITVEDPIEYRVPGITQIQVDDKIGMTFASGLRSILRQDPDIIMVGEIRDLETAKVAFQAAQTGHLVLATLHTNNAASAVVRLVDLGLEPYVIAPSLGAIVAQRLVRRVCKSCAVPLTPAEADHYRHHGLRTEHCRAGRGCSVCMSTGYRGRVGVYSLLEVDSEMRELIRSGASEDQIDECAQKGGMRTLLEAGVELVERGLTTLDEVIRVIGPVPRAEQVKPPPITAETTPAPNRPAAQFNTVDDLRASLLSDPAPAPMLNGPDVETLELSSDKTRTGSIADLALAAAMVASVLETRTPKILLVDDDEGVRVIMSRALRRADFEVVEARDGQDALEKLERFEPDLIVSDLAMPRLDGEAFVTRLRSQETTARTPVLVLTASDHQENQAKLLNAGANDFISKSCPPAEVIDRIKRLLNPA